MDKEDTPSQESLPPANSESTLHSQADPVTPPPRPGRGINIDVRVMRIFSVTLILILLGAVVGAFMLRDFILTQAPEEQGVGNPNVEISQSDSDTFEEVAARSIAWQNRNSGATAHPMGAALIYAGSTRLEMVAYGSSSCPPSPEIAGITTDDAEITEIEIRFPSPPPGTMCTMDHTPHFYTFATTGTGRFSAGLIASVEGESDHAVPVF